MLAAAPPGTFCQGRYCNVTNYRRVNAAGEDVPADCLRIGGTVNPYLYRSGTQCPADEDYTPNAMFLTERNDFGDFSLKVRIRTGGDPGPGGNAAYAVVFHYQDPQNFGWIRLDRSASRSEVRFRQDGEDAVLLELEQGAIVSNGFADISLSVTGDKLLLDTRDGASHISKELRNPSIAGRGALGFGSIRHETYFDDVEILPGDEPEEQPDGGGEQPKPEPEPGPGGETGAGGQRTLPEIPDPRALKGCGCGAASVSMAALAGLAGALRRRRWI
jgi:hypothetical protein